MKKILSTLAMLSVLVVGADCADINTKACAGCHGVNFEKSALGKSKIVKDMNTTSISNALIGYKDGTYGGAMKGIMKGQVAKYSDKELQDFAKTVGTEDNKTK